jgi:FAD/FMN-containing dehydrogenase/Fe-S oxidoreductase
MNFNKIVGEVLRDKLSLALYSTDASLYQKLPQVVVVPKNENDIRCVLREAVVTRTPVLPRGSATSLAGQTVNEGVVLDYTKYFNRVLEYNVQERYAVVQPGVTRDQLNLLIKGDGLHFAPDPATSSRATIGGMTANNSSGTKSILYGKTSDHVIEMKIMTTSGSILTLSEKSEDEYDQICNQSDEEGHLYRSFRSLIYDNFDEIKRTYPKVMRRVGGYALDAFVNDAKWNLSNVILGSEGTLAQIIEIKVKLTPLPKFSNMVIVHFDDRLMGIKAVKDMVQFGPAAIEMLDFNVLVQSRSNAVTKKYYDSIISGNPQAVMTVEFYGKTQIEIDEKADMLCKQLKDVTSAYAYPVTNEKKKINDALALRKEGLGLLMCMPGIRKPLPFVEDAAIPLEFLAEYIDKVEKFCHSQGSEIVLYAHASVGVLHVRPIIDLTKQEEIDKMKIISDYCFELVKNYGGAWSGEHGDGRVRGPKVRDFYGEQIYNAFKQVKEIFDPIGILNPNIIVDTEDMRANLRYFDDYKDQDYEFQYHYRGGANFQEMIHNCSGVGACRNTLEEGTMCPSFRATGDEIDSTRGRANSLRLAMSGQMHFTDLTHPDVKKALDLCLSCKACKSECPSNVDMSKLKAEVLQINYDKNGASLGELIPKYASILSKKLSGYPSLLLNPMLRTGLVKQINRSLLGISKKRDLPAYAKISLAKWSKSNNTFKSDRKVVVFADTYINYHEVDLGIDLVKLLNKCGYEVIIADIGCCQRPKISNGFLKDAKIELNALSKKLEKLIDQSLTIITVEPSCTTALIDDLPDLIDDVNLGFKIKNAVLPAEQFLLNIAENEDLDGTFVMKNKKYIHHGHCHQKAVYTTQAANKLMTLAGGEGKEMKTGCCGMAGAFGYEEKHYELSVKIAKQTLVPGIMENADCEIVANGFSCRSQIKDLTNKKAVHIISALDFVKRN